MYHKCINNRIILLLICIFSVACIHANEKIDTIPKFQNWLESKVLCKNPAIKISIIDKDFVTQMKQLGFDIDITTDEDSQSYEGEVLINNKSITVFDFNLQKISFYQDSGAVFYAFVQASPSSLKKIIENHGLDKFLFAGKIEENDVFTFLTSKPELGNPYGIENQAIIIKTTNQDGVSMIGCSKFDY